MNEAPRIDGILPGYECLNPEWRVNLPKYYYTFALVRDAKNEMK